MTITVDAGKCYFAGDVCQNCPGLECFRGRLLTSARQLGSIRPAIPSFELDEFAEFPPVRQAAPEAVAAGAARRGAPAGAVGVDTATEAAGAAAEAAAAGEFSDATPVGASSETVAPSTTQARLLDQFSLSGGQPIDASASNEPKDSNDVDEGKTKGQTKKKLGPEPEESGGPDYDSSMSIWVWLGPVLGVVVASGVAIIVYCGVFRPRRRTQKPNRAPAPAADGYVNVQTADNSSPQTIVETA